MRDDRPLYVDYEEKLFSAELRRERDEGKFEPDFENFVNSRFAKGRTVLIDSKVEELDFKIPRDKENILICPLEECLRYLSQSPDRFICLTLGTSVLFPRVNLERIPAKEAYLAEIHACCAWMEDKQVWVEYRRISLYRVDGLANSRTLIARYEKNKELLEDSLQPGEELMNPANYSSVGDWKDDGRAEYQIVPLQLCHAVSQIERKYNLQWPESYYFLQRRGLAVSAEGIHAYNLAGDKLWLDKEEGSQLFDGFPYLVTFVVPALCHIILLPGNLDVESWREIAFRQVMANRLETFLVLGRDSCVHFLPDGTSTPKDSLPVCPNYVTGRLQPCFVFPEDDDLRTRAKRLDAFIADRKQVGYISGDLQKGGRLATPQELKQLSGVQDGNIPRGLVYCNRCGGWRGECLDPNPQFKNMLMKVHCQCENDNRCARCGFPLFEYKLNANYFDPKDGQIWHVPGFLAFRHVCPDRR